MDSGTNTEQRLAEINMPRKNILLEMIKELCAENKLCPKLKGKVSRIISDCDLTHHSSLHKLCTADESTSTILGFIHQTSTELSYDEQSELNQAVINKIQTKLPTLTKELETLKRTATDGKKSRKDQIKDLKESLDDKLNTLEEQENEKVELMMEWLNHRLTEVTKFSDDSSDLLSLKTKILDLKSKILHLQILQSIFTETDNSIKAYSEIHKDLKHSIKETEERIKQYKEMQAKYP